MLVPCWDGSFMEKKKKNYDRGIYQASLQPLQLQQFSLYYVKTFALVPPDGREDSKLAKQ